ncbi:hypothetical protein, partial [uncultured Alistipes sp.]|uniref:hypothetical protein n=1 Tax=uncultured Alistipes sp. TaxID=538949 RepID=UPI002621B543
RVSRVAAVAGSSPACGTFAATVVASFACGCRICRTVCCRAERAAIALCPVCISGFSDRTGMFSPFWFGFVVFFIHLQLG